MEEPKKIYIVSYSGNVLYATATKKIAEESIKEELELDEGEEIDDYIISELYFYEAV